MADPRDREYARLLVDTCVGVQPGWQVLVQASPLARPLVDELLRTIAERGAYALLRLLWSGSLFGATEWIRHAPMELLENPAPFELRTLEEIDALIVVQAPENTRQLTVVDSARNTAHQSGFRPAMDRVFNHELPWVGCQYPTPALAQEAGLSLREFEDFLYGCLLYTSDAADE